MKIKNQITTITFNKTSNLFVNVGIVGLFIYLEKYQEKHKNKFPTLKYSFKSKNEFNIECENLLQLLEEVYYFMGKKIYDTATKKQKDNPANVYYDTKNDRFEPFPKMNTYGLTHLLTNNAQGVTRNKEKAPKIKNLKKDNPELAEKIEKHFEEKGLKLLSKVYIDEPYTKITRLDFDEKYLLGGALRCPILGENFKTLLPSVNVSPFVSGLANFNSFLNTAEKKISWKATYLIRFAPVLCFYTYQNNFETIICNFFNSNSLIGIKDLYDAKMYQEKEILERNNFLINFELPTFKYFPKGGSVIPIDTTKDVVWQSEIAIMLLYTFYKKKFQHVINKKEIEGGEDSVFLAEILGQLSKTSPISLVTFKADKFAATLRPNAFEEYNQVKYIFRLLFELESKKILFRDIWQGLRISTPKARTIKKQNYTKGMAVERQIRGAVFNNVLKGHSILNFMEELFVDSYKYLIAGENTGYRLYNKLEQFLLIYEYSINLNKTRDMEKTLQEKAISLGHGIGIRIRDFEEVTDPVLKRANIKSGRKYIFRLHKARTWEQLTEQLIAIMKKFTLNNKIIEQINEDNFMTIRQYTIIGALNVINGFLNSKENKDS